jgi:taurine---2-oxoglutarate transaminase
MNPDVTPDPARGAAVYAADRAHVFHSWSAQKALKPLVIAGAQGCYVWDYDGRRYLDFSSQLVNTNIGHQHPRVTKAIADQAARLTTIAPQYANEARGEAASRLTELAPDGFSKVFFTNGGADANENAIRMARLHTGRDKVLSFYRSYHGNTGAAINSTGDPRRWPNEYATGHVHFFGPYLYRSSFWASTPEQESQRALEHLEQVIQFEGPGTIAAILIESIVGTAGVLLPPPGYLAGVRALCDEHGIVWIADEVMCGFGRAGSWFAFTPHGVAPDLITFAKGANSGYVPIGGVLISDPIAATFDAMRDEGIVENAAAIGQQAIGPGLAELADRHPVIGEVRGLGVFWALDLVSDRATRAMLAPYGGASEAMTTLAGQARAKGLLTFTNYNRLHVVPPCTITEAEAKEGLAILDDVLTEVDRFYVG